MSNSSLLVLFNVKTDNNYEDVLFSLIIKKVIEKRYLYMYKISKQLTTAVRKGTHNMMCYSCSPGNTLYNKSAIL